jgi:nucleoside 2-deoxyribosyltransferase
MKKVPTVYLAGPIEGCTEDEITLWRNEAANLLSDGIRSISPTRMELVNPSAVITQNYMDIKTCDVVLAYLPKCISDRRCSYGTVCELAWAYADQAPVVIVSDDPYIHEHPVLKMIGVHFDYLEDGISYINQLRLCLT